MQKHLYAHMLLLHCTRDESIVERLHGVEVADPYRWLESPDAEETKQFCDAQNKVTNSLLEQCTTREPFRELLTEMYDYPRFRVPSKKGSRYYYRHNTGLQNQDVVYTQASLDAEASVLMDPNKWSEDGTVSLGALAFSKDGNLLTYSISKGGSDWQELKMMRIDQGSGKAEELKDVLKHVKFSSTAWTHDHKGFFYNRYPVAETTGAGDLGTETDINENVMLVYHRVGTPQSEDVVVLAEPEHPKWMLRAEVSDDGRYMMISVSEGTQPFNRLWYVDLSQLPKASGALDLAAFDFHKGSKKLPVVKLVDSLEASWDYVANEGTTFTLQTNYKAPRCRIVKVDLSNPGPLSDWQDVVSQHEKDLLEWACALKGDNLVTCYLADVRSQLQLRSLATGSLKQSISLPGIGSINSFSGRREDSEFFFSFSSFANPGAIYRVDVTEASPAPHLFRQVKLKGGYNPEDDFDTKQVFVTSKDGTKVPMFIVMRKGTKLDGSTPTLLYGYGGFNINLSPGFSPSRLCWMLGYGIYAVPNLRGGGEYGLEWRHAGSNHSKQNTFDDMQAAAEFLINEKYTSAGKLVIQGASNGGLLVAACANQRPDLFGAVLAQVGVMDMLRFHKFTIGHAWTTDYGNPDKEADFHYILRYSPVHNVRQPTGGTRQYPAILITTGDHDDRVVPLHSHKLLATLQHTLADSDDSPQRNPLVARIETKGGHGAGKPTGMIIAEVADMYAFAAKCIGAQWIGKANDQ
eukprot:jgi/Astpho2/9877/fgenesh1_pm.00152_%23_2_t